jgi:hypothetical protein
MKAAGPSAAAVLAQLEKILGSPLFLNSERMSRFLRFVVEETLAGRAEQVKEAVVGAEVYRRGDSFDPRNDATVRVEASKLRGKLSRYYETEGRDDQVVISIPKGGYVPVFETRDSTPVRASWPLTGWVLTLGGGSILLAAVMLLSLRGPSRQDPPKLKAGSLDHLSGH